MIGEICYWIFNMSIIGSLMGLIVLLITKIKIIPKRISIFLYLIPFIRLVFPIGIGFKYSLMNLISKFTTKTVVVYEFKGNFTGDLQFVLTNALHQANSYFPIEYKVNILDSVFSILGIIWLVISLAMILTLIILYFITKKEIKDARCIYKRIYVSSKIDSPSVYGIFNPKIVIPSSYSSQNIKYILSHEVTHIKRGDNLWRMLGFIVVCIHWFNPIVWILFKQFLSDIELSCDEMTISKYDLDERKMYASTLLNSLQKTNVFVSAFGGAKIRTRIENVLSYKKMTIISSIFFIITIVIITITLLTNAT